MRKGTVVLNKIENDSFQIWIHNDFSTYNAFKLLHVSMDSECKKSAYKQILCAVYNVYDLWVIFLYS